MRLLLIFALIFFVVYCNQGQNKNYAESETATEAGTWAKGGNKPETSSYAAGDSDAEAKGKKD